MWGGAEEEENKRAELHVGGTDQVRWDRWKIRQDSCRVKSAQRDRKLGEGERQRQTDRQR